MDDFQGHGTGNAAFLAAAEWVLYLAAAVETILFAGLVVLASRVEPGSALVPAYLRLNALVLGPFTHIPVPASAFLAGLVRQVLAILVYGGLFGGMLGGLSWLGRRQALS